MTLPTDTAGPFDVNTDDLAKINAQQAVDLFRQLLVIEAARVGVPISGVDVPADINVADGGIDAEVATLSGSQLPGGLISTGRTCYQIKTGKFSASTPSDIRSLLVQPKYVAGEHQRTKEQLQPRVLNCFESGATFVVVLFGTDLVGTSDDHGVKQIKDFMAAIDPAFGAVDVRIVRANQLCAAIKMLAPGIALQLNRVEGFDRAVFQDISFMAECCDLEFGGYQPTAALTLAAEQITQVADGLSGFKHVRVLGDAGAGKTHLIYRALSESKLKGCVLYCRDPEDAVMSRPLATLTRMAADTTIILVADECSLETAEELTALFKRRASKMLLLSADNVAESTSAHANVELIDVPPLEQTVIAEIFRSYDIPVDGANWLATLCEGSPRAAHRLGQYMKAHPEEQPAQQLAHLDGLWDLVVCAPHKVASAEGREKLAVIRTLALFRQVAWETAEGAATQGAVLAVLKKLDSGFSPHRLASAVEALRRKRVLQGIRTLLISPKLLHVAMWRSWFDLYSPMIDVVALRDDLGVGRMRDHFDEMLTYAKESRAATALADRLMGDGGPFASLAGFSAAGGASLFFAVAQAKPKVALRRFAMALGAETVEVRKEFIGDGRRMAVHRLEQLAVPAETFFEAADCLLLLAEAENESWSNNATGVFVSLFGLGYGPVAASELSPRSKTDYLRRLLASDSSFRRQIAVQALSKSLDPFMSRTAIDEVIGLRRLPDRWHPKNYGELFDAFAAHVALLEGAIGTLPPDESIAAAKGILEHVRSLVCMETLGPTIIAFLRRASTLPGLREVTIEAVVATLHYEGKELPEEIVARLEEICTELTESSFSNKLRRRAAMKLIEDNFDADGNFSDAVKPELEQLAADALAAPILLESELSWLVTEEAKNGYQFGVVLGQADKDHALWSVIRAAWVAAGPDRSDYFIGGYLSAHHESRAEVWEKLVDELLADPVLRPSMMGLIWRSGMTDRVAASLLALARSGEIDVKGFRLLTYGGIIDQLPQDVLTGAIDLLLDAGDAQAMEATLDILLGRLRGAPGEIGVLSRRIERTLNAASFVEGGERALSSNMLQYQWNALAKRFLGFDADRAAQLAVQCIRSFGADNSVTAGYHPESLKFLTDAAQAKPDVVWAAIAQRLIEQRGGVTTWWRMLSWLRGGRSQRDDGASVLDVVPEGIVFEWVDADTVYRARTLAEYCPPYVSQPGEPTSFARRLLERYGDMEDVRRCLHANNFTDSWGGPASEHYRRKLEAVNAQLSIETNENVQMWLEEHRERLEHSIQREVERELDESEG